MKKKTLLSTSEPIKVLRKLQALGFPSAIIAGGAIRDEYTGVLISDYDIFLWDPNYSPEPHLETFQPHEQYYGSIFSSVLNVPDLTLLVSADNGYAEILGDGVAAQLTTIWQGLTDYHCYQIIFTKINPVDHVNKFFDIGFCKAYCDAKKIRYTQDFMNDLKNQTFTIVGKELTQEQFNYTMDYHVEKLHWKYPKFQVKVAPHNQLLLDTYNKG